jgi:hypothetical protein
MECNKLNGKFLKVKAKVSGFLIARIEKRNTPKIGKYAPVIIKSRKNTITGLQYLINAFLTYMRGVPYTGATAQSSGIFVTTSTGITYGLSLLTPPIVSATENSAIVSFIAMDDSSNSYTATSEQLITQSAGYNIPIATANLTVTKNADEVLTLTWVITISISTSGGIAYIPTSTPQPGGWNCSSPVGSCSLCQNGSANSLYPSEWGGCSPFGLSSKYLETSFVTTQLFTDMFYNTYGTGSSNPFVSYSNGILYIYTLYCTEYFAVGINVFSTYQGGNLCFTANGVTNPIYVQVYLPTIVPTYMGVQIELTT